MRVVRRLVITLSLLELAIILLAGLLAGCGSGAKSPVAPTPSPAVRLEPGSYVLTLTPNDSAVGGALTLCVIRGSWSSGASAGRVPVTVSVNGHEWTMRATVGSLEARFETNGNHVGGTGTGEATAADGLRVTLGSGGAVTSGPATLTGSGFTSAAAGGTVEGWVGVGGYSCSAGSWSLSR